MTKYNKLVRDKIPEIIESEGRTCKYRVLSDEEFREELHKKLIEEALEFNETPTADEAADIMEVLNELFRFYGIGLTTPSLAHARHTKANARGRFEKRIFLEEASDD